MTGFKDEDHKLIQPLGYYEGATVFKRYDLYYIIWSEGLLFQLQGTDFPPSIRYAVAGNQPGWALLRRWKDYDTKPHVG